MKVDNCDSIVESVRKHRRRYGQYEIPALGGAIVWKDGRIVTGVSGVRAFGKTRPVGPEDYWHIGSCAKQLLGKLIGRLEMQGKLSFETTLGEVFGHEAWFNPAWQNISLGLLLQHRGGAPKMLSRKFLRRLSFSKQTPRAQRLFVLQRMLQRPPLKSKLGKKWYSNAGYIIATALVEEITNVSFEELLKRQVFDPLHMDAGFGAPGSLKSLRQPRGHLPIKRKGWKAVELFDNSPAFRPAGGVHTTLECWALSILPDLRRDRKYLPRKIWKRLHTPPKGQTYAMGWGCYSRKWAGGTMLAHGGSNGLWYCCVGMAPKKGFAVLATCNAGGRSALLACNDVANALRRLAKHTVRSSKP